MNQIKTLEFPVLGSGLPKSKSRHQMRSTQFWRQKTLAAVLAAFCLTGVAFGGDKKGKDKGSDNLVESDVEFGIKMAQRGLWKEALFRFQQADLQRPNNSRLLNNIAVAYEAVGAYDKALETYKQALQANASDRELKQNYSRFLEFYQAYNPAQPSEADKAAEAQATETPEESGESGDDTSEEARSEEPEGDGAQAEAGSVVEPEPVTEATEAPESPSSSSGQ